jgi:uncharacterized protein YqjF (DUF2071 family)
MSPSCTGVSTPGPLEPLFPPGTAPDTLDGRTYVGLVAFQMARCGIGRNHPVPWPGVFSETNVRLYSVDDEGRRGVRFLTMHASCLATVALARVGLRLAYTWAHMRIEVGAGSITDRQRRRLREAGRRSCVSR